jgi:hypothetical protein
MFKIRNHSVSSRGSRIRIFVAGLMLASACTGGDEGSFTDEPVAEVAQASSITYIPLQDTWAQHDDGGTVDWGRSQELRTNNVAVAVRPKTILVRFPVELEKVCSTLSSATLSLHSAQLAGSLRTYVHRITSGWMAGITGHRDPVGACDAYSGVSANFTLPTVIPPSTSTVVNDVCTRFQWNVTSIVQDWCNDPGSNHGFLLAGYEPNGGIAEANFFSMEGGPGRRPTLDITY